MKNQTAKNPISVAPSQAWDGNDGPWSTFNIHVGTPPQLTRVLVSSVVGETWVISDNKTQGGCLINDSPNCAQSRGGLINVNKSSTWEDQGIYGLGAEINLPDYVGNYDNGDYALESLGLGKPGEGGVTLTNQVVAALATKDFYLGNLGLTSRPTNFTGFNDPHTSFLSSLKEQNHIPSLTFGYTAGNQYRLKKVFGSLTLGGYDQSKFTPNDVSFQFATDISRDLVVGLQSVTYSDANNKKKILLSEGILTFVDTTVPHIWLPKDACTAFEKAFGLQYNSTVNRYLVNDTLHDKLQEQNATVSFTLGNDITGGSTVQIDLPYSAFDLAVGPPIVNNTQKYFPLRRADNETQYTLGRTFLQESYLIVDYERSNFSISQCLFEGNSPSQLLPIESANLTGPGITKTTNSKSLSTGAIVGIVVAVAILLALSGVGGFFFMRRRKHKRQLEEEEKRQAEEDAIDPTNQKAELGGIPRLHVNELYGNFKPGYEVDARDMNEMEGSKGLAGQDAKMRAEMEGSRGGAEMESHKPRHEMHAPNQAPHQATNAPAVEMWAGPHGLYELSPDSEGRGSSGPSPQSRLPSSAGTGPSPASPRGQARNSGFTWGRRRQLSSHSGTHDESSGVSSPTDDPPTEHESGSELWGSRRSTKEPQYPPRAMAPQEISPQSSHSKRARRGDNLTRRLEQASKPQSGSHLSVSSPTSESDSAPRQQTSSPARGADRFNARFGSQARDHIAGQHQSTLSPPSAQRSRHPSSRPRMSPRPEVSSPSEDEPPQPPRRDRQYDSWTSRVTHSTEGSRSPGISSPSSESKRDAHSPGGFF